MRLLDQYLKCKKVFGDKSIIDMLAYYKSTDQNQYPYIFQGNVALDIDQIVVKDGYLYVTDGIFSIVRIPVKITDNGITSIMNVVGKDIDSTVNIHLDTLSEPRNYSRTFNVRDGYNSDGFQNLTLPEIWEYFESRMAEIVLKPNYNAFNFDPQLGKMYEIWTALKLSPITIKKNKRHFLIKANASKGKDFNIMLAVGK